MALGERFAWGAVVVGAMASLEIEYGEFWGTIILAVLGTMALSGAGVAGVALAAAVQDEANDHSLEYC